MRVLLLVLRAVAAASLLWPAALAAQRLDPGALGAQDTRFLQAALVWSGDYVGLTDGDWGPRSQEALDAALRRTGGDPGPLLRAFAEEVAASGWSTFDLDGRLTVALPTFLLRPGPEDPDRVEFASPDDSLVFRIHFGTIPGAWEMHDWMLRNHAGPEASYHSAREDRVVTRSLLADGTGVYLRSAFLDGFAVSMQVLNDPWQEDRAALIASTMQWGAAPDLLPTPGGPLARLLAALPALPAPPEPPAVAALPPPPAAPPGRNLRPAPAPALPASALLGTGTGFFVNNTDVVTANHVIESCRETRLEDGTPLRLLAADAALDLAVLSADRRSPYWLPLADSAGPRLGEPVFALGFPYSDLEAMANQGLSVTGGNVSALPRVADAASRIMLSAPVQPGNSGGPLLSDEGAVVGVVVSRIADDYVLDETGTLPQNMNYATSVAQLAPFLQAAGVLFPSAAERPPQDLSQGIPDEVQAAVVLIGCY